MSDRPMIELRSVRKRFPNTENDAVTDLSLSIGEGDIVVLVGPSGCGKTTTLRMINRLVEPSAGSITVGGESIEAMPAHELRRTIGYVIQQIGLFPHRTIAQNIATVPSLLGWDKDRIASRVLELADLVAIDADMLDRFPAELSGGQRQRAGVARALAADPPVLLMDEPFGAVDPIVRQRLQQELLELQRSVAKTIVLVTHDIDEAILIGDKVAVLNTGGVLEQYSTPAELLARPANVFVADFLGSDRGIKRLSLLPLDGAIEQLCPLVAPDTSTAEAEAIMRRHDLDWALVLDEGRLVGQINLRGLSGATVGDGRVTPFRGTITPQASLKDALEAIVSTNGRFAVVCEAGRYVGTVSPSAISREIAS